VGSLKDFARIEVPDQKQPVDVNDIVGSAMRLIDNLLKKSTKILSVEYGQGLPRVQGSFQRLEQVVVNLVQNACEALPDREKGIHVSTRYVPEKRSITVTIHDEGVGIPADKLSLIMDPFFTTKRQIGGTGLGLSVSAGIVKDHGGTLSFKSTSGKGTEATLVLPVAFTEKSSQ
jgi:signal transduction histidine kinase